MDNIDSLWKQFANSGKVNDYLAYCSIKDGTGFGSKERTNDVRRTGSTGDECWGER